MVYDMMRVGREKCGVVGWRECGSGGRNEAASVG